MRLQQTTEHSCDLVMIKFIGSKKCGENGCSCSPEIKWKNSVCVACQWLRCYVSNCHHKEFDDISVLMLKDKVETSTLDKHVITTKQ